MTNKEQSTGLCQTDGEFNSRLEMNRTLVLGNSIWKI